MPGPKLEDRGAFILDNWHINSIDIDVSIQFLFLIPQVRLNAHISYMADPLS